MSKRRTDQEIAESNHPTARFVRSRRKKIGYTQEELAQRIGVGVAFLKRLETGDTNLQMAKVIQVLDYLGAELYPRIKKESET